MKAILFVIAMLCASAQFVPAAPDLDGARVGQWTMDLDAAKKLAAEKNLPLFLNFTGSDWCGWCKLMDKKVFTQEAWQSYATQAVVLGWIDFPQDKSLVPERYRERNRQLSEQYHVEGYPSYVVLDSDGKTELGRLGANREITPAGFIQELQDTLANRASALDVMLKDLGPERGTAYKEKRARLAAAREERDQVQTDAMAALKKLADEIETLEKDVEAVHTDWKISKLTDEQRKAYGSANQAYEAQRDALKAWLGTEPEQNDENQQKFSELSEKLQELEQARNAALRGP